MSCPIWKKMSHLGCTDPGNAKTKPCPISGRKVETLSDFKKNVQKVTKVDTKTESVKHCRKKRIYKSDSGPTPDARVGSGATAPPLAAHPKQRVLEKILGQLEASFLFPTLGSIKQSNTQEGNWFWPPKKLTAKFEEGWQGSDPGLGKMMSQGHSSPTKKERKNETNNFLVTSVSSFFCLLLRLSQASWQRLHVSIHVSTDVHKSVDVRSQLVHKSTCVCHRMSCVDHMCRLTSTSQWTHSVTHTSWLVNVRSQLIHKSTCWLVHKSTCWSQLVHKSHVQTRHIQCVCVCVTECDVSVRVCACDLWTWTPFVTEGRGAFVRSQRRQHPFTGKGMPPRPIGCLQVNFRTRATNYRALWRIMTYKDKASYVCSLQTFPQSLSFAVFLLLSLALSFPLSCILSLLLAYSFSDSFSLSFALSFSASVSLSLSLLSISTRRPRDRARGVGWAWNKNELNIKQK